MILWFSGTGNSRYAAEGIAAETGEPLFCIGDRLRQKDTSPVHTGNRIILVCPVYAWRIPQVVEDWLRQTSFPEAKDAYFILTCGADAGNAGKYLRKLCEERGWRFQGMAAVPMPDNYILMFPSPTQEEIDRSLAAARTRILSLSSMIRSGTPFPAQAAGKFGWLTSGIINPLFTRFQLKRVGFSAGEGCVSCGKCTELCPLDNIHMENGKPVWGTQCTHCTACLNGCPRGAVEFGKSTVGKTRYFLEKHWSD